MKSIEKVETHHVAFSARPVLTDDDNVVALEDLHYEGDANDMPELTRSLIDNTKDLLDLRNFEMSDMSLQFDQLTVEADQLIIEAKAKIESFSQ